MSYLLRKFFNFSSFTLSKGEIVSLIWIRSIPILRTCPASFPTLIPSFPSAKHTTYSTLYIIRKTWAKNIQNSSQLNYLPHTRHLIHWSIIFLNVIFQFLLTSMRKSFFILFISMFISIFIFMIPVGDLPCFLEILFEFMFLLMAKLFTWVVFRAAPHNHCFV